MSKPAGKLSNARGSSYAVDRLSGRTIAPHGLTSPELKRMGNAVHFMEVYLGGRYRNNLWWASTHGSGSLGPSDGERRDVIAGLWKRITRYQAEEGLPQYSLLVFEADSGKGLHAHVIFVGSRDLARRLECSQYGDFIKGPGSPGRVYDARGLINGYLAKKRTPQAGYRRRDLGGRLGGSHRLPGSGDRVRLSRLLELDAVDAGYVEQWRHTNATRKPDRKPYRLRRLYSKRAPRLSGQIALLPEVENPVARLRDFGGGYCPRTVAMEIEYHRGRVGLTQAQLGKLVGVCQGHLANFVRGHDPVAPWVAGRFREVLLGNRKVADVATALQKESA